MNFFINTSRILLFVICVVISGGKIIYGANFEHSVQHSLTVCGVCEKECAKLYRCSLCHLGEYCSVQCQKNDWKEHKEIFHTPEFAQQLKMICASCKMPSIFPCSACKDTYYCSQACQKKNWKEHKAACVEKAKKLCTVCSKKTALQCSCCKKARYCSQECQKQHRHEHKKLCFSPEKTKQLFIYEMFRNCPTGAYELLLRAHEIFSLIRQADPQSSFFEPFNEEACSKYLASQAYVPIMLSCYKACKSPGGRAAVCEWLGKNALRHAPLLGVYLMLKQMVHAPKDEIFDIALSFKLGCITSAVRANKDYKQLLAILEEHKFKILSAAEIHDEITLYHKNSMRWQLEESCNFFWLAYVDKIGASMVCNNQTLEQKNQMIYALVHSEKQ